MLGRQCPALACISYKQLVIQMTFLLHFTLYAADAGFTIPLLYHF
jgi:hypothetical protein